MKLTRVNGTFLAVFAIALISSFFGFVPNAGGIVSAIVMLALISKWTDAEFWPDAVLLVIVARGIGFLGGLYLLRLVHRTIYPM